MMKRYILPIILAAFASTHVWAEGQTFEGLQLAKAPINETDMASIKRGAKFFATNCMSCHSLSYLRYDDIAKEAGISPEKTPANMMTNGVKPPDLSLEADVRGVDWIYTYLHSFYQDKTRPSGVNNLLLPGTAMPDMVASYQGDQILLTSAPHDLLGETQWFDWVELTRQGIMAPDDFDKSIADLVDFLAYAAEPYHAKQVHIGQWVLGFLVILFVLMYLLKHEYWRDVKKLKE
jgi:ubiquinol-cytochrome c reductase cytochrome c1 subunit